MSVVERVLAWFRDAYGDGEARGADGARQWSGQDALGRRAHAGMGLHHFRRLRVRYERRAEIHQAFLTLGGANI